MCPPSIPLNYAAQRHEIQCFVLALLLWQVLTSEMSLLTLVLTLGWPRAQWYKKIQTEGQKLKWQRIKRLPGVSLSMHNIPEMLEYISFLCLIQTTSAVYTVIHCTETLLLYCQVPSTDGTFHFSGILIWRPFGICTKLYTASTVKNILPVLTHSHSASFNPNVIRMASFIHNRECLYTLYITCYLFYKVKFYRQVCFDNIWKNWLK